MKFITISVVEETIFPNHKLNSGPNGTAEEPFPALSGNENYLPPM